jgi:hypothetical protein
MRSDGVDPNTPITGYPSRLDAAGGGKVMKELVAEKDARLLRKDTSVRLRKTSRKTSMAEKDVGPIKERFKECQRNQR